MKRLYIFLSAAAITGAPAAAQTFHVGNNSVIYSFPTSETGTMPFGEENTLTIMEREFSLDNNTEMWTDDEAVEENVVTIVYSGSSATVDIAGNIARYVDASVSGAHVSIVQSEEVSEETCGEITYRLSGASDNGSLLLEGEYKSSLELLGLELTNPSGAALDIQNGKRISVSVKSGTTNTLADGASGSQKGCIVCKGHLEFKGKGELTVSGNASHAVYAKEYVELKNCTLNVTSAIKDGINCNQYFMMESGTVNISGTGDDGIQVAYKDDTDREAEDTGAVILTGGTINISVTADAVKGIKCEGPMTIDDGDITVTSAGHGIWDSDKNKTKAASCLASDEDIVVNGGHLQLTATGSGGKGISCDGTLTINGGDFDISTSGGVTAYVRNVLYTNYTGNTDNLDSDMKSSPKGIKADADLIINNGNLKIATTGNGGEGIESKAELTINGGDIYITSSDDAINSSGDMHIKGGNVTVIGSSNDGLDSNGNLYIEGGYIMAFGAKSPECGIDANEERGYSVVFTGGTLLAVGGSNSVPSASSGSTQPYISGSGTVSADMEITLSDSEGNALASFTVPAAYSASSTGSSSVRPGGGFGSSGTSVLVSCPGLENGSSYTLSLGSTDSSVSARLSGSSQGGFVRP